MKQIKRKSLMIILALVLMVQCAFSMKVHAADGSLIIAMETDIAKGDTVSVLLRANGPDNVKAVSDMKFTYNKDVFEFVSAGSDSYYLEEEGILHIYETHEITVKLKAIGTGETVLKVTGSNGKIKETGASLSNMVGAGVPLEVVGSSSGNTNLSNDNSLVGINISTGVLSPEFSATIRNYTVTVPFETTSLEVSAQTSSSVATTTITGGEELVVGENIITIAVKAENGDTVEYTVVVTREEEQTGTTTPDVDDKEDVTEEYQNQITNLINQYNQLREQYQQQKVASKRTIMVLVVVIVILIILCFGLILFVLQKGKGEEDDDFGFDKEEESQEEEEWLDDDEDEEPEDMEMIDFDKWD